MESIESILKVVASQGFLEKAVLLLLTALLTGILVPLVKWKMDQTAFKQRKTFEALIARQSDVIKAQISFLTNFSEHIWEYHKISQRVSYSRLSGDNDAYVEAVRDYKESLWESLQRIRSAIGGARWFTSDRVHRELTSWYDDWFLTLEVALRQLIDDNPADELWRQHHTRVHFEAGKRNYALLRFLAEEFGLQAIVEGQDRESERAKRK